MTWRHLVLALSMLAASPGIARAGPVFPEFAPFPLTRFLNDHALGPQRAVSLEFRGKRLLAGRPTRGCGSSLRWRFQRTSCSWR
jgi:hypothetical protein